MIPITKSGTLERNALYKAVWSTPMTKLAAEIGLSGRGLAKICGRLKIPVPPRGYWAKVQAGKKVRQMPLPETGPETPNQTQVFRQLAATQNQRSNELPQTIEGDLNRALEQLGEIAVPKTLKNPHPIIVEWRKHGRETQTIAYHDDRGTSGRFDNSIEKRRLRILSSLFKAWELLGHSLTYPDHYRYRVNFSFGSEQIEFRCEEYLRQFRRPLTLDEKVDPLYQHQKWRQIKEPTGTLIFEIKSHILQKRTSVWKEIDQAPLETQVTEILQELLIAGLLLAEQTRHREEERRIYWEEQNRFAEIQRREEKEEERWQQLVLLAKAHEESKVVLSFLESAQSTDIDLLEFVLPSWCKNIDYAKRIAIKRDPLR